MSRAPAFIPATPVLLTAILASLAPTASRAAAAAGGERPPNIVIILTDDQGYADAGFQGSEGIPTPHIDRLAAGGVRFTDGYVSHPYCSPSRAGLLTGRYQQRFGHETNPTYLPTDERVGLPAGETTLADLLRGAGYRTGAVGKWHLGAGPPFRPRARGFDEFFGFLGGGHDYFTAAAPGAPAEEYTAALEHNDRPIELDGYLTDVLSRAAVDFIRRHRERPFLLYLAYNAPHTPFQAPPDYRARFADREDDDCRTYAAMVSAVDDGVGQVVAALGELGLERRTVIFFLSDNGGQTVYGCASNGPLRGRKSTLYEGGVRVPFVVAWPSRLPAGEAYGHPVTALDILPTAAALAGAELPADRPVDGVDLLPYLTGERAGAPHDRLFWRLAGGAQWAVREGRFKLVKGARKPALYDLRADPGEARDLALRRPELVRRLTAAYRSWNGELVPPRWPNPPPGEYVPASQPAGGS